jgi:hypothetical protein
MKSIFLVLVGLSTTMSWYCQSEKIGLFKERNAFLDDREGKDRLIVTSTSKLGYAVVLDTLLKVQMTCDSGVFKVKEGAHEALTTRYPVLKSLWVKCPDSVAINKISHVYVANFQNDGWTTKKKLRGGKTMREFDQKTNSLDQRKFHSVEEVDSTIASLKKEFFVDWEQPINPKVQ